MDEEGDDSVWMPLSDGANVADGTTDWSGNLRSVVVSSRGSGSKTSDVERKNDDGDGPTSSIPANSFTSSARMPSSWKQRHTFGGSSSSSSRNDTKEDQSLLQIQRRLETKQQLKDGLVDRPLKHFASKFIGHLCRDLWNQDYYLRSGLALIGTGCLMQILAFAMIGNDIVRGFFRYIFVILIVLGSYLYLYRPDETVIAFARFLSTSKVSETFYCFLESLNPGQLRSLCCFALLLPTLLEMKAITFLASILVESGWKINFVFAAGSSIYMYHLRRTKNFAPRDCSLRGLIVLKASALFVTIAYTRDIRRLNTLAGPFIIAAGSMVISNHPALAGDEFDWLSRAVRHALRLTLRDTLGDIGQNVSENEMLKLAMMRWSVDYWSYWSAGNSTTSTDASATESASSCHQQSEVTVTNETVEVSEQPAAIATPLLSALPEPQLPPQPQQQQQPPTQIISANADIDIQWSDLWAMLDMTTDQMLGEVNDSNSASGESDYQQQPGSDHTLQQGGDSVQNLKAMLESLDVDGRAKPAVQAYKTTVDNIPPSRNVAIALSIARRCPALLALLSWYCFGCSYESICAAITLLPCVWMEIERLRVWSEACHRAKNVATKSSNDPTYAASTETTSDNSTERTGLPVTERLIPQEIEPMTILLSPDSYSPYLPTSSLKVWANIEASVGALETGLTAVRAARTTVAATELTFDVVNLAQFGVQVYKKGLLHGTALIARDVCQFLAANSDQQAHRSTRTTGQHGRYTAAAVNAARNSQVVARNVSVLIEDEGAKQVLDHAVGAVMSAVDAATFVFGRGWLWGTKGSESSKPMCDAKHTEVPENATQTDDRKSFTDQNKDDMPAQGAPCYDTADEVAQPEESCTSEDRFSADDSKTSADEGVSNCGSQAAAVTMQLMANAFEKGLITEHEKCRFIETILADQGTIESIGRSLQCLIDENSSSLDTTSENHEEQNRSLEKKPQEPELVVKGTGEESSSEEITDSDDALASVPLEASGLSATISGDSWVPADQDNGNTFDDVESNSADEGIDCFPGTPLKSNRNKAALSGLECSRQLEVPDIAGDVKAVKSTAESEYMADKEDGGSDDEGDEGSWTQIDTDGVPREIHDATGDFGHFDNQQSLRTGNYHRDGKGDDWMKWVGGGLAVAGAVIGSIALANQNNQSENAQTNARNSSTASRQAPEAKTSSVTIELLDSDEE